MIHERRFELVEKGNTNLDADFLNPVLQSLFLVVSIEFKNHKHFKTCKSILFYFIC